MCTFPSYLLGVLCSWSLLNVLFKSTAIDLLVSWKWSGGWLVGANPGISKEGTAAVSVVLPTVSLGGKVFGRRSGRPDCMAAWDGRKTLLTLFCERSALHAGTCWNYLQSPRNLFLLVCSPAETCFQVLPLSPSVSSLGSVLTWCWSEWCWLLLPVWANSKSLGPRPGPEAAVFFKGPCTSARRFLDGEAFTVYKRKSVNYKARNCLG